MDTENKIAEQAAEIARLTKTIAWYQGQAGQRIGEAARAGIMGAQPTMPTTAAEVIAFIGSNYDAMHERGFSGERLALDDVRFELTVHDLLSAFSDARDFPFEFAVPAAPAVDRNAALEEAAMICERLAKLYDDPKVGYDNGYTMGATRAAQEIRAIKDAAPASVPQPTDAAAFKNFHRALCGRFNYTHDDQFWWRDQVSLIEHIAASVPQLAVPQGDLSDDGIVKVLASFGIDADKSKYGFPELQVSTNIPGIRKIVAAYLAAAPAAPLPELTGPSAGSIGEDATFDDLLADYKLAESRSSYAKALAALVAYIDRRYAASPSPAPAQQQEPSDLSKRLREIASDKDADATSFLKHQLILAADEIERLRTAKSHLILQAQIWHCEAKSQRATVTGILARLGLPENDWEAKRLIVAHIAKLTGAPVPRMGSITSKESVEPAAPGASTEDKQ